MHESTYELMRAFRDMYLSDGHRTVLDVGSLDVNGSYRDLFPAPAWEYVGIDIKAGRNVDHVVQPYDWSAAVSPGEFDVVISGQCAEHVPDIYAWARQVGLAVRAGGMVCVIAPWKWKQHRYPVDCWRLMPDGMRFLLGEVAGLAVIEATINPDGDCRGVAGKDG
jgi:hypothetical protein